MKRISVSAVFIGVGMVAASCSSSESESDGSVVVASNVKHKMTVSVDGEPGIDIEPMSTKKLDGLKTGKRSFYFTCSAIGTTGCLFVCVGCAGSNQVCALDIDGDSVPTIVAKKGPTDGHIDIACPSGTGGGAGGGSSCTGTTHRCADGSCCNVCCGSGGGCC